MFRKTMYLLLVLTLLIPIAVAGAASTKPVFKDLNGHWAKEYVNDLVKLGVYTGYPNEFKPDTPITRGEALILINRVRKAALGNFAPPLSTNRVDFRYWGAGEIKELLGNLNSMFYTDQRMYIRFNPAENLLYYLHLSAAGKKMRSNEKMWSTWSLSSAQLSQPLSREEASEIFFHVLAPYIARSFNVQPMEVESRFDSYYAWKEPTNYLDNPSPYATALQEYAIYTPNQKKLEPAKKMTRAEFAVTLKRLHETYLRKTEQQREVDKLNFFLTAATYAYQRQDQAELNNYFEQGALTVLKNTAAKAQVKALPLHHYLGQITVLEKNASVDMKVQGIYKPNQIGSYEIMYYLKINPESNNPYGLEIYSVDYLQK